MRKIIHILILTFFSLSLCFAHSTKITLLLDWFINPNHAPIFVAKQDGFFKKNGLDVHILEPADPNDAVKLVAAKQADIGITYGEWYSQEIKSGLPIHKIGDLISQPLDCLITLKNTSIQSISDLKGKRIGYSASSANASHIILKTMLAHHGLALKDVTLIHVNYGLVQGLLAGKLDAFSGGMRNIEPVEMALMGHPARIFLPEKNGVPHYSELIFITHKANAGRSDFKKFMISIEQATQYLKKYPKKSWQKFIQAYPHLNNEINQRIWLQTIRYF